MVGKQAARGYSAKHRRLREAIKPTVEAGNAVCYRCGERIKPGDLWDLDHTDSRDGYGGPSHRACNRSTAGHNPMGIGTHVIESPRSRSATRW